MSDNTTFADIDCARKTVRELYPDAQHVEFIEHGYDNIVALVDKQVAVRFPRNEEASIRSQYERSMLGKLGGITSIQTPQLLATNDNPPYIVTKYIDGGHLNIEDIADFSPEELHALGEAIGRFAYELHSSVSVEDEKAFRAAANFGSQFSETWDEYFTRVVDNGDFSLPEQTAIAKSYYDKWKVFVASPHTDVLIHDDLHIANLLFEGHKLVGILDFAEANIGTAEQEFRQLFRINQDALQVAVELYEELAGRTLDREGIRIWAVMQDLASYSRRLVRGETDHPSYIRSRDHLAQWLPEGNWNESSVPTSS